MQSGVNTSAHRIGSIQFHCISLPAYVRRCGNRRAMFADEITGNIYSRYSNPNPDEFIAKLCLLEGTEDGIATSSGMAAMYRSMAALLNSGDHVLPVVPFLVNSSNTEPYFHGSEYHTSYADVTSPDEWEKKFSRIQR